MANEQPREKDEEIEQADPNAPVVQATTLFGSHKEIWIDHQGVRYRLRITRRNRLILQK
jgi:hemin uptake protein HemP